MTLIFGDVDDIIHIFLLINHYLLFK